MYRVWAHALGSYTSDVTTVDAQQLFTITPEARQVVLDALSSEAQSDALALFVEVVGVRGSGYAYDLYFSEAADAPADAVNVELDGVRVVIPAESAAKLHGSRLEFTDEAVGLVLVNPNAPSAEELHPGVPPAVLAKGLDTPMARRAVAVLEDQINPAIAGHGGRADLVALDDEKMVAFVRLSGGCQGCAMSRMTLSQGIETMLKEEIPELVGVVDVTDHASGDNPFYS